MRERLTQLGWREIEVVDEDLGRSAAGLVTRSGFERTKRERTIRDYVNSYNKSPETALLDLNCRCNSCQHRSILQK
jgi:hypothetical protein